MLDNAMAASQLLALLDWYFMDTQTGDTDTHLYNLRLCNEAHVLMRCLSAETKRALMDPYRQTINYKTFGKIERMILS